MARKKVTAKPAPKTAWKVDVYTTEGVWEDGESGFTTEERALDYATNYEFPNGWYAVISTVVEVIRVAAAKPTITRL